MIKKIPDGFLRTGLKPAKGLVTVYNREGGEKGQMNESDKKTILLIILQNLLKSS